MIFCNGFSRTIGFDTFDSHCDTRSEYAAPIS